MARGSAFGSNAPAGMEAKPEKHPKHNPTRATRGNHDVPANEGRGCDFERLAYSTDEQQRGSGSGRWGALLGEAKGEAEGRRREPGHEESGGLFVPGERTGRKRRTRAEQSALPT